MENLRIRKFTDERIRTVQAEKIMWVKSCGYRGEKVMHVGKLEWFILTEENGLQERFVGI